MSEKSPTNDPTITNPKDAIGSNKVPLHLWPETATVLGAMALLDGALKYGRSNYRAIGVRATIYADAAKRHLNRWLEGRDIDPESELPELAHSLACIAILIDAAAGGKLNDDRLFPGGYHELIDEMTPHVARLKEKYANKAPKHYTIADDDDDDDDEAVEGDGERVVSYDEWLAFQRWKQYDPNTGPARPLNFGYVEGCLCTECRLSFERGEPGRANPRLSLPING